MNRDCHALPGFSGVCDKGTVGCDACEHCICHRCYGHENEGCTCATTRPETDQEAGA